MKNIIFSIYIPIFLFLLCDFSKVKAQQYSETGMASYYASKFHGKKTACGEKYDMNGFTAAHPKLPFNTMVKVTNLKNKKSVIVRINDRGPHTKKRIIDLSKAAAQKIGLIQAGVARVKIEIVNENGEKEEILEQKVPAQDTLVEKEVAIKLKPNCIYDTDLKKANIKGYVIQVGSYSDVKSAIEVSKNIQKDSKSDIYIEVVNVKSEHYYRILSGTYKNKSIAQNDLVRIKKSGYKGFIRNIE